MDGLRLSVDRRITANLSDVPAMCATLIRVHCTVRMIVINYLECSGPDHRVVRSVFMNRHGARLRCNEYQTRALK